MTRTRSSKQDAQKLSTRTEGRKADVEFDQPQNKQHARSFCLIRQPG